jgi:hypothetical protein
MLYFNLNLKWWEWPVLIGLTILNAPEEWRRWWTDHYIKEEYRTVRRFLALLVWTILSLVLLVVLLPVWLPLFPFVLIRNKHR